MNINTSMYTNAWFSNVQELLFDGPHRQPHQRHQPGIIQGAVQAALFGDISQQMAGYGFETVVGEMGQALAAFFESAVMGV